MAKMTEKELMAKLGLTDDEVASLLCKQRQTINAGLNSAHKNKDNNARYFSDPELLALLIYCRRKHNPNLPYLESYIRSTRQTENTVLFDIFDLKEFPIDKDSKEIWAILPDYRIFARHNPSMANRIRQLAKDYDVDFKMITSSANEKNAFLDHLGISNPDSEQGRNLVCCAARANALPYMLIINPKSENTLIGLEFGEDQFIQTDPIRAAEMLRWLKGDPEFAAAFAEWEAPPQEQLQAG
ncbi:hypothetical protein [Hyphococcus sp.]|uniref:hypothetical protein n=1 Tax=Hyphococcus sp. TaxID=2038636 RepID=UPI003CCC0AA2